MGNCLMSSEDIAHGRETNDDLPRTVLADREDAGLERRGGIDAKSGSVRIRVVVTQQELKQLLSCTNGGGSYKQWPDSSVEQLLVALRLRSRSIGLGPADSNNNGFNGAWRPALESIPEDR